VIKIIEEPILGRQFEDWAMELADTTRVELDDIGRPNDSFGQGIMFSQLGAGRTKKTPDGLRRQQLAARTRRVNSTTAA
jgi:hypothetical protein